MLLVETKNSSLDKAIKKYKLRYRNLILYLNSGSQLKKTHRILEFKQQPFLKLYITCNTNLRTEVETESNKIKIQNAKLRNNVLDLVNRCKIQ